MILLRSSCGSLLDRDLYQLYRMSRPRSRETFTNLVVVQQELLGHAVDATFVKVYPFCKRESVITGTSSGAGDDWSCQLFVAGPHIGRLAVDYSVTVRPNGCYTARPTAVIGPLHIKTPDGGRRSIRCPPSTAA